MDVVFGLLFCSTCFLLFFCLLFPCLCFCLSVVPSFLFKYRFNLCLCFLCLCYLPWRFCLSGLCVWLLWCCFFVMRVSKCYCKWFVRIVLVFGCLLCFARFFVFMFVFFLCFCVFIVRLIVSSLVSVRCYFFVPVLFAELYGARLFFYGFCVSVFCIALLVCFSF